MERGDSGPRYEAVVDEVVAASAARRSRVEDPEGAAGLDQRSETAIAGGEVPR